MVETDGELPAWAGSGEAVYIRPRLWRPVTADGFGNYHTPDRCGHTAQDFADGIPADAVHGVYTPNLVWLRYMNPEKLRAALTAIVARS